MELKVGDLVETLKFGYRYKVVRFHKDKYGEDVAVCEPIGREASQLFFFPVAYLEKVEIPISA